MEGCAIERDPQSGFLTTTMQGNHDEMWRVNLITGSERGNSWECADLGVTPRMLGLTLLISSEVEMEIPEPLLWMGLLVAFYLTEILWFFLKRLLLRRRTIPLSRRKRMLVALACSALVKNGLIIWQLLGPLVLGLVISIQIISADYAYILEYVVIALLLLIPLTLAFKSYFGMTTPVTTALWLRRFHTERSGGANLSKAFEVLSITTARVITLADSKVTSSRLLTGQCYLKLGIDVLSFVVIPIAMALCIAAVIINMMLNIEAFPEAIWLVRNSEYVLAVAACMAGIILLHGLYSFISNVIRVRFMGAGVLELNANAAESFVKEENRRSRSGSGASFFSGKAILRIGDAYWQEAVERCIKAVSVIIVDASEFSDNLLWEVQTVVKVGCGNKVLVISEGAKVDERFEAYLNQNIPDWPARWIRYGDFGRSIWERARVSRLVGNGAMAIAQST
jgi:hypothetical protein